MLNTSASNDTGRSGDIPGCVTTSRTSRNGRLKISSFFFFFCLSRLHPSTWQADWHALKMGLSRYIRSKRVFVFVVDCSISEPCCDLPGLSLRRTDLYKSFVFAVLFIIFKESTLIFFCRSGSSVVIATELRARRFGIESRWGRDFPPVQTGPGAHPASCKMGTGSFLGVEAAEAWSWLPIQI